jgi:hypothetical protein
MFLLWQKNTVICESFRRWLSDDGQNTLLQSLQNVGFEIVYEDGTNLTDTVKDVFQYIIAVKK